jgi:hypothetical protein
MPVTTPARQVSFFLKVNRYSGTCAWSGDHVEKGEGFVQKDRDTGKWITLCESCVRENSRAMPLVSRWDRDPDIVRAMSVATGEYHDVLVCNTCDANVARVKSKRGKWYLANCYRKRSEEYGVDPSGTLRVYDFDVHDCEPNLRRKALALAEDLAVEGAVADILAVKEAEDPATPGWEEHLRRGDHEAAAASLDPLVAIQHRYGDAVYAVAGPRADALWQARKGPKRTEYEAALFDFLDGKPTSDEVDKWKAEYGDVPRWDT